MDKEQEKKVIETFNRYHSPFYIVAHESGDYSLCHPMGVTGSDFGQVAFDLYAMSIGEKTWENSWRAHGNGYEWEDVFRNFFKDDPHIEEIHFDCETGGFYCDCQDLQVLLDMGIGFTRQRRMRKDSRLLLRTESKREKHGERRKKDL